MKEILSKIPAVRQVRQLIRRTKNKLYSKRNHLRMIESVKIHEINQSVKKAVFIQDIYSRSPRNGAIVECGVAVGCRAIALERHDKVRS
jgi:hypothetical protein